MAYRLKASSCHPLSRNCFNPNTIANLWKQSIRVFHLRIVMPACYQSLSKHITIKFQWKRCISWNEKKTFLELDFSSIKSSSEVVTREKFLITYIPKSQCMTYWRNLLLFISKANSSRIMLQRNPWHTTRFGNKNVWSREKCTDLKTFSAVVQEIGMNTLITDFLLCCSTISSSELTAIGSSLEASSVLRDFDEILINLLEEKGNGTGWIFVVWNNGNDEGALSVDILGSPVGATLSVSSISMLVIKTRDCSSLLSFRLLSWSYFRRSDSELLLFKRLVLKLPCWMECRIGLSLGKLYLARLMEKSVCFGSTIILWTEAMFCELCACTLLLFLVRFSLPGDSLDGRRSTKRSLLWLSASCFPSFSMSFRTLNLTYSLDLFLPLAEISAFNLHL